MWSPARAPYLRFALVWRKPWRCIAICRVPSVRFALLWLNGRRKRERLRRINGHVPIAGKGDGAPAMWPECIRRRGAADTARRRRMATGGIPTEPCAPHSRLDGTPRKQGGCAVAEWRGDGTRRPPVPTVAENAPEAERPLRSGMVAQIGRTRRQSCDCRAVRDDRANARYARRSTVGAFSATR